MAASARALAPREQAITIYVNTTPGPAPQQQVVTIYLDGNGNFLGVDKDPFYISKSAHQEVLWQTSPPGKPFSVVFEKSPFYNTSFNENYPYSGEARREVPGDGSYYKYTVTAGNKSKDPGGVVNG